MIYTSYSFTRIVIRSPDLHNAIPGNKLRKSTKQIAIRENELCESREQISNPWERIPNLIPKERIAQFVIPIFVIAEIPVSSQNLQYDTALISASTEDGPFSPEK